MYSVYAVEVYKVTIACDDTGKNNSVCTLSGSDKLQPCIERISISCWINKSKIIHLFYGKNILYINNYFCCVNTSLAIPLQHVTLIHSSGKLPLKFIGGSNINSLQYHYVQYHFDIPRKLLTCS